MSSFQSDAWSTYISGAPLVDEFVIGGYRQIQQTVKVDSISSSYAVIQWTLGFRDDGCKYTDFMCLRGTASQRLVEPYMQSSFACEYKSHYQPHD